MIRLLLLILLPTLTYGQLCFETKNKWEADIKVYISDSKWEASKVVYYVDSKFEADTNLIFWAKINGILI